MTRHLTRTKAPLRKKGSEGGRTAPVDYADGLNYLQAALKEIVRAASY